MKAAGRNPYSWNMELYSYSDGSGYEARFTACGICILMRELGLYDLVPAMCRLDYTMCTKRTWYLWPSGRFLPGIWSYYTISEVGGISDFVREYTLVSGGPYCDCGCKKKQKKI